MADLVFCSLSRRVLVGRRAEDNPPILILRAGDRTREVVLTTRDLLEIIQSAATLLKGQMKDG